MLLYYLDFPSKIQNFWIWWKLSKCSWGCIGCGVKNEISYNFSEQAVGAVAEVTIAVKIASYPLFHFFVKIVSEWKHSWNSWEERNATFADCHITNVRNALLEKKSVKNSKWKITTQEFVWLKWNHLYRQMLQLLLKAFLLRPVCKQLLVICRKSGQNSGKSRHRYFDTFVLTV